MDGRGEHVSPAELRRWCSSGLLALTGHLNEPVAPPLGLVAGLDALVERLERASACFGPPIEASWEELVLGRAALRSFTRAGRRSANGSCRLVPAADGWVALNLPRQSDHEMLGALLETSAPEVGDAEVDRFASALSAVDFVDRARLLGLAAAKLEAPQTGEPVRSTLISSRRAKPPSHRRLRVVDLSSMWAGPLCAAMLAHAGAEVLKVESIERPDGAREDPAFYAWLHGHEETSVRLDFSSAQDRARLRGLLEAADVVIESSRPRALSQLGLSPESLTLAPGTVWVGITAHGREEGALAVGFGDDAAVAGGLVGMDRSGRPVFCADAIADPITGLLAARCALEALAAGGGVLLDVSMSRASASVLDPSCFGRVVPLEVVLDDGTEQLVGVAERLEISRPALPRAVER
jgi:hypothetical protein